MTFNLFRSDISTHITAHDLLKTLALLLMFVDHVGHFFMENQEELRLLGRLSSPLWFFLIGYAMNRKMELRLWIWGTILAAGFFVMKDGTGLFPLNILFNFLFIRATLEFVMRRATQDFEKLFGFFWIFIFLILPSHWLFEYGTVGYLFAMAGYLTRHKNSFKNLSMKHINIFMLLCVITYGLWSWYVFDFEYINVIFLLTLLLCMCLSLLHFKPHEFQTDNAFLKIIKYPLFLTGRRTLEIYVLHLLIFMYIATYGLS